MLMDPSHRLLPLELSFGVSPSELYDLRADPLERVNQYDNAAYITTRAAMAKQLRAWREKFT